MSYDTCMGKIFGRQEIYIHIHHHMSNILPESYFLCNRRVKDQARQKGYSIWRYGWHFPCGKGSGQLI